MATSPPARAIGFPNERTHWALLWMGGVACGADAPLADGLDPVDASVVRRLGRYRRCAAWGVTADTDTASDTGVGDLTDTAGIQAVMYEGSIWLELFTEAGNDRCEGAAVLDATNTGTVEGAASDIACRVFGPPFEATGSIRLDPDTCTGWFVWSGVEVPFEGDCDASQVTGTLDATWIDGWIDEWDQNATLCGAFVVEPQ